MMIWMIMTFIKLRLECFFPLAFWVMDLKAACTTCFVSMSTSIDGIALLSIHRLQCFLLSDCLLPQFSLRRNLERDTKLSFFINTFLPLVDRLQFWRWPYHYVDHLSLSHNCLFLCLAAGSTVLVDRQKQELIWEIFTHTKSMWNWIFLRVSEWVSEWSWEKQKSRENLEIQ